MKCLAVAVIAGLSISASNEQQLCEGFVPENDLSIPVGALNVSGVTEADFNKVLDIVQAYYGPHIASLGGRLSINRDWQSTTVNASAERSGSTYRINMYGGLARHPAITKDGFMLVACHEIGHHIGGYPKSGGWFNSWATNEGGADYYANLRCLRLLFTPEETAQFVESNEIDPVLKQTCEEQYQTQEDENICMRAGMAGLSGATLFQVLREEEQAPRFDTPDTNVVPRMDNSHPGTQCRLDTYYNGTICTVDQSEPVSDEDPNVGACTTDRGFNTGVRPRCWFKP